MPKPKVRLSGKEKSLESIWSWYEDQVVALKDYKNKIFSLRSSSPPISDFKFKEYSTDELDKYFDQSQEELEQLFCLDIIAATEALLKRNYFKRVYRLERKYQKDNSGLSQIFRKIFAGRKLIDQEDKVRLKEDIIENWKNNVNIIDKEFFSRYLGILHYRHWLAHGLYWKSPTQKYLPNDAYEIAKEIFRIVNLQIIFFIDRE
ncbi:MAG: hypothetical protein ABI855_08645 [Bacteroidota bacterium]